jgi:Lipocalin-like domain
MPADKRVEPAALNFCGTIRASNRRGSRRSLDASRKDMMNRKVAVLAFLPSTRRAILFVILLLLASSTTARADDRTALVGSWRLVSYEDRDAIGTTVYPYGKAPEGLLVYLATGHMAVQMMKTPPPSVASDDWDRFTPQEKVALFDGYVAYFGKFEVDPARKVVTHLPVADLSRLYVGKREERHYQLTGDRLVLSETWTQSGKQWSGVRVFQRNK